MKKVFSLLSIASLSLITACASGPFAGRKGLDPVYFVRAPIEPTKGYKAKGFLQATEAFGQIKIYAVIEGLTPKGKHAIQIHRWGDCRGTDGMSAGPVYSPSGAVVVEAETKHIGQLGNLEADKKGVAILKKNYADLSLSGNKNSILGRSIIIFEESAELTDHPETKRVACGVIGAVKK